ncbi:IclR family transcriptional regulator [Nocardioides sp.]|uniref:IclR family transcriptional regulator n=1 Tax=Nocardioides sp. TaxID=35761 RepID=UPI00262FCB25|nr:IclR family transcriptional regulator [Nocardioides sp.]
MAALNVVAKTALLLRAIAACEPEGATTSELARRADLNRSTAHRLLSDLHGEGLVDRDEPSARWLLGPALFFMGLSAGHRYDVTQTALPFVRRLAAQTSESAFYSVWRSNESVCLVQEEGTYPLRSHVLREGIRFPLGVASAGLAVLSFLPETEIETYLTQADLSAFGPEHGVDALRARIDQTRRQGYAVNPGLIVEGSWGMAAAVVDERDRPVGALSVTGVEQRFSPDRQPDLGRLLMSAAHELSLALREPRAIWR